MNDQIRVCVYARVNPAAAAQERLELQKKILFEFAERHNMDAGSTLSDITGGNSAGWPGLAQALESVKSGQAQAVPARSVACFSRNNAVARNYLSQFSEHGAQAITPGEGTLTDNDIQTHTPAPQYNSDIGMEMTL